MYNNLPLLTTNSCYVRGFLALIEVDDRISSSIENQRTYPQKLVPFKMAGKSHGYVMSIDSEDWRETSRSGKKFGIFLAIYHYSARI